jgi:hypothetical protein
MVQSGDCEGVGFATGCLRAVFLIWTALYSIGAPAFLELVQDQYGCFATEWERTPREVFVRRVVEMDEHGYADKRHLLRDVSKCIENYVE